MAWVCYRGPLAEPSVTLTEGPLVPWGLSRRPGARNLVWVFPRNAPRRVPAIIAAWVAAVRFRDGGWFEVRLERGEWQRFLVEADGLFPWPDPGELAQRPRTHARRRAYRAWRSRERKRRRRGAHAKVWHCVAWANPVLAVRFRAQLAAGAVPVGAGA